MNQQRIESPTKCSIALFCCHFDYNFIQPTQNLKRTNSSTNLKDSNKKQRIHRQRRSLRHKQNSQISGIQNKSFDYSSEQSEFRFRQYQNSLGINMITPQKDSQTHPLDRTIINQKSSLKKISLNQAQKLRKQKSRLAVRQECMSSKNCYFPTNHISLNQGQRLRNHQLEHYFENGKNIQNHTFVNIWSDSNNKCIKNSALKKSSQLQRKNQICPIDTYNNQFFGQQKKVAFQFPNKSYNHTNPENKLLPMTQN